MREKDGRDPNVDNDRIVGLLIIREDLQDL